jgi:hypothetical protein
MRWLVHVVVGAVCMSLVVAQLPPTFSYASVGAYGNFSSVCAPPVRNQVWLIV